MLRRHFLLKGIEGSNFNDHDINIGTPDYTITYTATLPVRFMGGCVDLKETYSWREQTNFCGTTETVSATSFKLVLDLYDEITQTGVWGFVGNIPRSVGGVYCGIYGGKTIVFGGLDTCLLSTEEGFTSYTETGHIITLTLPEGIDTLTESMTVLGEGPIIKSTSVQTITFPSTLAHLELGSLPMCDCSFYNLVFTVQPAYYLQGWWKNGYMDLTLDHNYWSIFNNIIVDSNNPWYDSRDNCGAVITKTTVPYYRLVGGTNTLYNIDPNVLLFASKSTTVIPDSVTRLNNAAFMRNVSLTSIVIPDNVTYIDDAVFAKCTNLSNVTIGTGVTYIGKNVFNGCALLNSITYNGTMTQWNAITEYSDGVGAWNDGSAITQIICSDGTITI